LYLSTDATLSADDLVLDSQSLISLSGGQYRYQYGDITVPDNLALGTYYLIAAADALDQVAESDKADNVVLISQIEIVGGANLSISGLAVDDVEWAKGDPITASWSVDNTGGAAAGGSNTRLYLSTDQIVDAGDIYLGVAGAGAIGEGGSAALSLNFAVPASLAPGTYYLAAVADDDGAVVESDENDNVSFIEITVPDFGVYGTEGADTLIGGAGYDELRGLGGDDILIWTTGGDIYDGGAGHDVLDLSANAAGITIYTLEFDDAGYAFAYGQNGGDRIVAVEEIIGTAFDDYIDMYGGIVDLTLRGGDGDDLLNTGYGADTIFGGDGDDFIWSFSGDDVIDAGPGNDIVAGDLGDDEIWLGDGADEAWFFSHNAGANSDGADIIWDFDPLKDKIYITYDPLDPPPDLWAWLTDTSEGVRIDYAGDSYILLAGVTAAELNAGNLLTEESNVTAYF
jgi:Ca2+-binding RTX toxin-like protein